MIPNGYCANDWQPSSFNKLHSRHQYCLPDKAFIVGIVGRYDALKGYDIFIEAAARITKTSANSLFLMIGRNVDYSNLELVSLIDASGGEAVFKLIGERSDISRLMSTMDVFCLSSKAEGFPNVVAEAMLMQLPCVVTNVGDAARIVGDTGFVVPSNDPQALAEAVKTTEELGEDGRLPLGKLARQRILQYYEISSVLRKYEHLYQQVYQELEV